MKVTIIDYDVVMVPECFLVNKGVIIFYLKALNALYCLYIQHLL